MDDLFALRFKAFTASPPPSTQIHNIQRIQSVWSVGAVDDLFALRFTAFRVFRAWGV